MLLQKPLSKAKKSVLTSLNPTDIFSEMYFIVRVPYLISIKPYHWRPGVPSIVPLLHRTVCAASAWLTLGTYLIIHLYSLLEVELKLQITRPFLKNYFTFFQKKKCYHGRYCFMKPPFASYILNSTPIVSV